MCTCLPPDVNDTELCFVIYIFHFSSLFPGQLHNCRFFHVVFCPIPVSQSDNMFHLFRRQLRKLSERESCVSQSVGPAADNALADVALSLFQTLTSLFFGHYQYQYQYHPFKLKILQTCILYFLSDTLNHPCPRFMIYDLFCAKLLSWQYENLAAL